MFVLLIVQLAVILGLCALLGRVIVRVGQAPVIGEMLAGVLLGPSCFGWLAPAWSAALFPAASLPTLEWLSQICLVVFMFFLGRRVLSSSHHTGATPRAILVLSVISMVVPFICGVATGAALHARFAPSGIAFTPFVLFVGAALSMTAFPVLARILEDFGLMATRLGTTAIACAAFDDLIGWAALAGILWLAHASGGGHAVARHLLLFASFVIAVALPPAWVPAGGLERVERRLMPWLLPLFFAFTGLRTSVRLIDTPDLWLTTAFIVAAAVIGKGGVSGLAALALGLPRREAWSLGVLLNTRGLIELVILSIGLDARVLTPRLYAMMIVMTLVTTCMASPLLKLLLGSEIRAREVAA